MVAAIISGTFLVIILGLIVANSAGFAQSAGAIGNVYVQGVQTLQGR